jgi:TRAP-type C4-dicarboxylate transport system permease small subunit
MKLKGEMEGTMKGFLNSAYRISSFFNVIAGIVLMLLMFLTVADVILRYFGRPILGTYELVSFLGAVVIGCCLPHTSWMRKHVFVDFLILRFSQKVRNIFNIATRWLVIFLCFWIGWNLIRYGMDLHKTGEVSITLRMPFYPLTFGIGICFFAVCWVLFGDIIKILRRQYD